MSDDDEKEVITTEEEIEERRRGNGTTKIFFLTIITFIILGIFIISNISISISLQKDIESLSKQTAELQKSFMDLSNSIEEKINEQSSLVKKQLDGQSDLIYRTIGNDKNVIIPEEYISSFRSLKESVDSIGESLNQSSFDNVKALYDRYLDETPSWVKAEFEKELYQVTCNMDYYKIQMDYEASQDIKKAVDNLHSFIMKNKDYEYLPDVIEYRNQLIDLEAIQSKSKK